MDGLAIAAAVIQFIDFAAGLFAKEASIYKSSDGRTTEHRELERITQSLSECHREIQDTLQLTAHDRELTDTERKQKEIGDDCQEVAKELLEVFSRLRTERPLTKWKSFRQALRSCWHDSKVQALEKRLERLQQQMVFAVLNTLRQEQSCIRQAAERVEELQHDSISIGDRIVQQLGDGNRWRRVIIRTILNDKQQNGGWTPSLSQSFTSSEQTSTIEEEIQQLVLQKLAFRNMTDREHRICKAHERTFKWIFHDPDQHVRPWSSFNDFLQQSNNTVYWITGKPASGKSTLMKYIRLHPKTTELLHTWSSGKEVIQAAFYFWNSGSEMQMSMEGLLQTLLRDCLRQLPPFVTKKLLPERWEVASLFHDDDTPWSWEELSQALRELITDVCAEKKFFIMIDGLDECSGEHSLVIDLILDLTSCTGNLKLCAASRPWSNFEDAFEGRPHLMLHDLTKADIDYYISSQFHASKGFAELQQRETEYSRQFLARISKKAQGVFLWVRLVVQSLLEGLTNGDGLRDLQDRLSKLPRNLEELYEKMLTSLDERYLEQASEIFQIVGLCDDSPTLLCVALTDIEHNDRAQTAAIEPMSGSRKDALCNNMKRKLMSRCKGLLEVSTLSFTRRFSSEDRFALIRIDVPDVQYLHRTVRDFLHSSKQWDWIASKSTVLFDPYLSLCKSNLLQLKGLNPASLHAAEFRFYIRNIIKYAKKSMVDQQKIGEVTMLLDETERTATVLTTRAANNTSTFVDRCGTLDNDHWSNFFLGNISQPSFNHLMVICGVHQYLETSLSEKDFVCEGQTPLLFTALKGDTSRFWGCEKYCDQPELGTTRTQLETIKVIMEKGGDCHKLYQRISAWEIAENLADRIGSEYPHSEIFDLFKRYGGSPASSQTSSISGINRWLQDLDMDKVFLFRGTAGMGYSDYCSDLESVATSMESVIDAGDARFIVSDQVEALRFGR